MNTHPLSNKLVSIKMMLSEGKVDNVEIHGFLLGYFHQLYNSSWQDSGSLMSIQYSIRQKMSGIPLDDKVSLVLTVKGFDRLLVHDSEIIQSQEKAIVPSIVSLLEEQKLRIKPCARCHKPGNLTYTGIFWRVECPGSCHKLTTSQLSPDRAITEWNN